jgi:NAD(P)H-quinone oxidoreductase subunit 4
VLPENAHYEDAYPREVFIAACFLLPIIAVGLYPKLATQVYDVTTVAINEQLRQSYTQVAASSASNIYADLMTAPRLPEAEIASTLGIRP